MKELAIERRDPRRRNAPQCAWAVFGNIFFFVLAAISLNKTHPSIPEYHMNSVSFDDDVHDDDSTTSSISSNIPNEESDIHTSNGFVKDLLKYEVIADLFDNEMNSFNEMKDKILHLMEGIFCSLTKR